MLVQREFTAAMSQRVMEFVGAYVCALAFAGDDE